MLGRQKSSNTTGSSLFASLFLALAEEVYLGARDADDLFEKLSMSSAVARP